MKKIPTFNNWLNESASPTSMQDIADMIDGQFMTMEDQTGIKPHYEMDVKPDKIYLKLSSGEKYTITKIGGGVLAGNYTVTDDSGKTNVSSGDYSKLEAWAEEVAQEYGRGYVDYHKPDKFDESVKESENSNPDYDRWLKALHLYDTSTLDSDVNRHDDKGKKPTPEQDKALERLFRGSKITSRFIMRGDFGRWKKASEKLYNEDCKDFGKAKVDDLVSQVLGIYNAN